jgi:hypothetical protein
MLEHSWGLIAQATVRVLRIIRPAIGGEHDTGCRPLLASDLSDLQFRLFPEPMPVRPMHRLATTSERGPRSSVAITRRPSDQFVDLFSQLRITLRAGLVAERRARQLQQDTGSAL